MTHLMIALRLPELLLATSSGAMTDSEVGLRALCSGSSRGDGFAGDDGEIDATIDQVCRIIVACTDNRVPRPSAAGGDLATQARVSAQHVLADPLGARS